MRIIEKEIRVDTPNNLDNFLAYLKTQIDWNLPDNQIPIRFVITGMDSQYIYCEVGVIENLDMPNMKSIFEHTKRTHENVEDFNIVLIIPTGIGCELGGHSGDGGAVARLFASIADQLITHPNVVNAADINELPENALYVEGSVLTRFLMGTITLQKVRSNRVILIVDKHEEDLFHELAVNAASSARAALGLNCPEVVIMNNPINMKAEFMKSGRAAGSIDGFDRLCSVLENHKTKYDAVALSTLIGIPDNYHADYFDEKKEITVNPWGGIEAMLTHAVSSIYNIPSAHSPMMTSSEILNLDVGIVDPRKASESISMTFLHCILKGLHRAPRILEGIHSGNSLLSNKNVSCIIIPRRCIGLPILAAIENDIPVIAVNDRGVNMTNKLYELPFKPNKLLFADDYLEAAGIASSLKAGVSIDTVRRPMDWTKIN